jgi:2-keto-4-pentenoate hydratase/2-oxohepta-3-ene-1,7-dioic acid hydratase in catechol pathway
LLGAGAPSSVSAVVPEFTYLPPISPNSRILCVGVNYGAHAKEASREGEPKPTIFLRTAESLVGHLTPLERPTASVQFDYEGELAVVIGGGGKAISPNEALLQVAGYTCFNDGSIRDFQKHSLTAGKNFDATGSCGPWIVTADAVQGADQLILSTRVNGETLQHASTAEMIYSIPEIIAYISTITALRAGDIIATGTPAGVGLFREPPRWLVPGDAVEVTVSGVGTLVNPIKETR